MKPGTIALSKDLRGIASALDAMIESSAGERVAFTLMVFTEDRARGRTPQADGPA